MSTRTALAADALAGRRALVTGAGSDGIGRATARALAAAGARLAVHHWQEPEGATLLEREIGAHVVQADFASAAAARTAVRQAAEALGGLELLVCCAAALLRKPALETTDEEWARVLAVTLTGTFACAQEAASIMARQGFGRIVIVSSVNQWTPNAGLVAYSAAKGGVMQMARTLALELAPVGVTVNLLAPGTIETDLNRGALAKPDWRDYKTSLVPAARIGRPEEVAAAAAWLCTDAAGYVTGATLAVDGGLSLLGVRS
ncbi:MAG: SDR family oxidoreductase [Alphaproteobacteria bacterium]|nr:SDR family oxidoreductase [Alphaproteobacteria bacterium]